MRIASYNVNSINARLPVFLRWLEETKPDIVCLQELKAPQEKFPIQEINNAGYNAVWVGQKSWNGVAILAREMEISEVMRTLPGDTADLNSRYIEVIINDITICCLYLPNGNPAPGPKFDYKLAWLNRLINHADTLIKSGKRVVIAGDYNIIPTATDVYNPKGWEEDALYRPEVRQAYQTLLQQGWVDAIRKLHPEEIIYTFWDYFRNAYGRNAGLRIDHFLLSPTLTNKLVATGVDKNVRGWEKTSDHAPVWIELK
jgi:exodeoxyribonuclease-3